MCVVLNNILKTGYHEARPFMVDDNITGCASGYGLPSGHSMSSMQICITALLDYLATRSNIDSIFI
jgi:membrane-associated phospholipid phosphatase